MLTLSAASKVTVPVCWVKVPPELVQSPATLISQEALPQLAEETSKVEFEVVMAKSPFTLMSVVEAVMVAAPDLEKLRCIKSWFASVPPLASSPFVVSSKVTVVEVLSISSSAVKVAPEATVQLVPKVMIVPSASLFPDPESKAFKVPFTRMKLVISTSYPLVLKVSPEFMVKESAVKSALRFVVPGDWPM